MDNSDLIVEKKQVFCGKCSQPVLATARYCAECGTRLVASSWSSSRIITVATFTLLVWSVCWSLQNKLAGDVPSKSHSELYAKSSSTSELESLRKQANNEPKNLEIMRSYATALINYGQDAKDQNWKPELLEVLSSILVLAPEDADALRSMAELSFDGKVFDKSAQYYERYITLNPQDLSARSRYASALTFMARFKEARTQLELVLKSQPENFTANAYLAITYAQEGQRDLALKIGEKAIKYAPSEGVRAEFEKFLERVKKGEIGPDAKQSNSAVKHSSGLEEYFRTNQILSGKFVRSEQNSAGEFKVYLKDFPMQAMPEFAKQKFFASIKQAAKADKKVSVVIILDQASGAELAKISIE